MSYTGRVWGLVDACVDILVLHEGNVSDRQTKRLIFNLLRLFHNGAVKQFLSVYWVKGITTMAAIFVMETLKDQFSFKNKDLVVI